MILPKILVRTDFKKGTNNLLDFSWFFKIRCTDYDKIQMESPGKYIPHPFETKK